MSANLVMFHSKKKTTQPVPGRPEEIMRLRSQGFGLFRRMVDTTHGHAQLISCEPGVRNGEEPARLFALLRTDTGHAGERAWLDQSEWDKLSEAERTAMITRNIDPNMEPTPMKTGAALIAPIEHENDQLARENADLRAQLEAATQGKRHAREARA